MQPIIANFSLASVTVGFTVMIYFGGLLALMWVLRARGHRIRADESAARLIQRLRTLEHGWLERS